MPKMKTKAQTHVYYAHAYLSGDFGGCSKPDPGTIPGVRVEQPSPAQMLIKLSPSSRLPTKSRKISKRIDSVLLGQYMCVYSWG